MKNNCNNDLIKTSLIEKFNMPLVFVKIKYKCVNKNKDITSTIIKNIDDIITSIFKLNIYFKVYRMTDEGPILNFIINDEVYKIKKTAVKIENKHILGKCIDINVYDNHGEEITTEKLGYNNIKCDICGKDYKQCTHTDKEILKYVSNKYMEFIDDLKKQHKKH